MANLTSSEGKKPGTVSFTALRVEPRLLVTETLTLAIPHVVTLEIDSTHEAELKKPDPKRNAGIAIAIATGVVGAGVALIFTSWIALGVAVAVALVLAVMAARTPDIVERAALTRHHLKVAASLGNGMQFTATRKETIDAVRRIISDKINDQGGASVFSIDFEKGTILDVGLGRVEPTGDVADYGPPPIPTGATRPATERTLSVEPLRPIISEVSRLLADEPPRPVSTETPRSLTARLGNGLATDNPYAVDYSKVLPIVADWNRYYEKQPNSGEITRRLSELETLMRAGTPTYEERSRVADLASDLTPLIGGADEVSAFFRAVSKLAGF